MPANPPSGFKPVDWSSGEVAARRRLRLNHNRVWRACVSKVRSAPRPRSGCRPGVLGYRVARAILPKAAIAGSTAEVPDAPLPAHACERHPGAPLGPLPHGYHRREPRKSVLHQVVRQHLETILAQARRFHREGYSPFIEREFCRNLDRGLRCPGFAQIRCPGWGRGQSLAYSCKVCLCPSCVGHHQGHRRRGHPADPRHELRPSIATVERDIALQADPGGEHQVRPGVRSSEPR